MALGGWVAYSGLEFLSSPSSLITFFFVLLVGTGLVYLDGTYVKPTFLFIIGNYFIPRMGWNLFLN
jgi:hypothetical protein